MTPADGGAALQHAVRLAHVASNLTPGAIDTADLDGMYQDVKAAGDYLAALAARQERDQ